MWPWEHAVVGYLACSLLAHLLLRRPPTGAEAVIVVLGSVLPDVIDKPLAWGLGTFPSGYAVGHSVFFAVPLAVAVVAMAARSGRAYRGVAFALGYLLHLPGDVLPHTLRDGSVPVERVLWPVRSAEASYPRGFVGTLIDALGEYGVAILSGEVGAYTSTMLLVTALSALLWAYDGLPGLKEPIAYLRR